MLSAILNFFFSNRSFLTVHLLFISTALIQLQCPKEWTIKQISLSSASSIFVT